MIREMLEQNAKEMGLMFSNENINAMVSLAAELKKWNSRINLTSITKDNEIVIKHLIDSLQLASHILDDDYLLDMGSGAGFPVIPLKIVKPETAMVSVDAVAKKINFQRHVIRILGLQGIKALHARVEDLSEEYALKFSIITSRAFTRLDHFVSLASPLLAKGGRLIAMKGGDAVDEIAACHDMLNGLGFVIMAIHRYNLPCNMGKHILVEMSTHKPAFNKGLKA